LQNQIKVQIWVIHGQYNNARAALLSLHGPGDWETSLHLLHAEDIYGINECALTAEEQEKYRHAQLLAGVSPESVQNKLDGCGVTRNSGGRRSASLSVLNKMPGRTFTNICPGLQVKWVKAHTCTDRWQEEVLLLEEEMCQAIAFCK
ncbi:hypothetical protein BDN71DRAFT_1401098, partial [Pleurotus eryngii]